MALLLRYRHLVPAVSHDALTVYQPPHGPPPSALPSLQKLRERGIVTFDVKPREDTWLRRVKRNIGQGFLRMFCMGSYADDWDMSHRFDMEVSKCMVHHEVVAEDCTVEETIVSQVSEHNALRVAHVPKLVAQAVVALRMKLGMGAMDRSVPGNVSVVRAEAAKMLREWNVRTKDAAAHLLEIERCFFNDDTHYRLSTWRARACAKSKFVAWVLGSNPNTRFDY